MTANCYRKAGSYRKASILISAGAVFATFGNPASSQDRPVGGEQPERAQIEARVAWSQKLQKLPRPAPGCYQADYPELQWLPVACGKARMRPLLPATTPMHAFTIGGSSGDFTARTTGLTTGAEGRFMSVSPGITETGLVGNSGPPVADTYSLQLNTDFYKTSTCNGLASTCRGWTQFAYINEPSAPPGYAPYYIFIQSWLINTPTCPSTGGWTPFGGVYCYHNSSNPAAVPIGHSVSSLASVLLSGIYDAGGDQVIFTPSSGPAVTVVGDNPLPALSAATGWRDSEFNIFGDGNGGAATFGPNTTMTVRTLTHSGTTAAPNCIVKSYTAETNNLTLVGMAPVGTLPSPGIEFTQSNIPGSAAACMTANGWGDTHLDTFGGLLYDFQATGDFTLALSGGFEVQNRQISGAPSWPNAAVNEAVAARLGKHVVSVCGAGAPERKRDVFINGRARPLRDGDVIDLGDGSGVRRIGNLLVMVDAEGNSLSAELNGNHINAKVGLGRWPVPVSGLLASGGPTGTQLTARGGATFTAPYRFEEFYGAYGSSWRVQPRKSMLKVCGRPKESGNPAAPFNASDLDRGLAERARKACQARGITDPGLIEACMIDVAMLGAGKAADAFVSARVPLHVGKVN